MSCLHKHNSIWFFMQVILLSQTGLQCTLFLRPGVLMTDPPRGAGKPYLESRSSGCVCQHSANAFQCIASCASSCMLQCLVPAAAQVGCVFAHLRTLQHCITAAKADVQLHNTCTTPAGQLHKKYCCCICVPQVPFCTDFYDQPTLLIRHVEARALNVPNTRHF